MKKISLLIIALTAMMATATFTACSSDDDNTAAATSNVERYQQAVDATVKTQKKHDKAILLVAFGSTWQQAFDTFDATKAAYEKQFPGYDIYLSFSSAICINRAAAGQHVAKRNFYAPNYWLEAFGRVQYGTIVVQSLQVIPGEEYTRVINYIKDFANNYNGDLDDEYLSRCKLYLGTPLMADYPTDVDKLAKELDKQFSSYASKGVVAFMGHGNPDTYDTYKANIRYNQLETALQAYSSNYFVGTVDQPDNYKNNVYTRMKAAGITTGKVYCHPLMSIAGDHANNDMAGDSDAPASLDENDEEVSWKVYFSTAGYTCNDDTQLITGLLELETVRGLWMQHTTDAINGEPLDFYHSKNPE
jgi:sirohydrochlorin cobaltochelatase